MLFVWCLVQSEISPIFEMNMYNEFSSTFKKRYTYVCFTEKSTNSDAYWSQLVTLFDYNAVLDDIITQVFQELDFDETIFTHPNFKDIAGFALSKSISLKRLSINDWEEDVFAQVDITQTVLDFMESFQIMDVVARYPPKGTLKYLEYATSLTISLHSLVSRNFDEFHRLVDLNLDVEIIEWDINRLTDILNKWRGFNLFGSARSQRSLKLSISQSEDGADNIDQCLTDLLTSISDNRDILTTSIHIITSETYPTPLTAGLY
ncbi:unnamed protein product [Ambrosiozyma monospora]|uniref:Unnamed protein product n=1 Tax=Ambrosiozyma monospora TaxID=43982 RepID=A0ACB5T7F3_AMBMO|nr:unnamed protein product [Ambrosiozyma monospora]